MRLILTALLSALCFVGCSSTSKPNPQKKGPKFTFTLTSTNLGKAPFQVDVVVVNPSTRAQLEGVSVNDYFTGQDRVREGVRKLHTYLFPDHSNSKVVIDEDLRYPRYSHLAVIANIPVDLGAAGGKDPRKLFLPLDGSKWPKYTQEIVVTITPVGMRTDPGWLE